MDFKVPPFSPGLYRTIILSNSIMQHLSHSCQYPPCHLLKPIDTPLLLKFLLVSLHDCRKMKKSVEVYFLSTLLTFLEILRHKSNICSFFYSLNRKEMVFIFITYMHAHIFTLNTVIWKCMDLTLLLLWRTRIKFYSSSSFHCLKESFVQCKKLSLCQINA